MCIPVTAACSCFRVRTRASSTDHVISFPSYLFSDGLIEKDPPPGVVNITPSAGDVVIMPECVTHGVLPWKPVDRQRRVLTLRYRPHHRQAGDIPEGVKERLAPETQELLESAHYTHTKEIAKRQQVCLSE